LDLLYNLLRTATGDVKFMTESHVSHMINKIEAESDKLKVSNHEAGDPAML